MDQYVQPSLQQPSLQQPSLQQPSNKSLVFILALIMVLLISLTLNALQYLGFFKTNYSFIKATDPSLKPNNPNLVGYGMGYIFEGQIKDIKQNGTSLQLLTNIKDIPNLYINDNTDIYKQRDSRYIRVTAGSLAPGQNFNLHLTESNNQWIVTRVTILP